MFTEAGLLDKDCFLVAIKFEIDTIRKFVDFCNPAAAECNRQAPLCCPEQVFTVKQLNAVPGSLRSQVTWNQSSLTSSHMPCAGCHEVRRGHKSYRFGCAKNYMDW